MKKLVLLVVAIATMGIAQAQMEVKINPLGALFGKPDVSGEYIVSDTFGVELTVGTAFGSVAGVSIDGAEKPKQSGFGVKLAGKYYFNPDQGGDGWYGGLYLRQESRKIKYEAAFEGSDYKSSIFAGGIEFGKKWAFDSGFLIEAATGIGRPFTEKREFLNDDVDFGTFEIGIDFIAKFAIGYRFN